MHLPELEFEIPAATQKGTITTLEGLLGDAAENLRALQEERHRAQPETARAIDDFLEKLDRCTAGQQAFTVILDDPAGNSYLESPHGNIQEDRALSVEAYDRTREQAAAVGLSVLGGGQEEAATPVCPCHNTAVLYLANCCCKLLLEQGEIIERLLPACRIT